MPSLDELQDEFGLDDTIAVKFLISRGYCLQDRGSWLRPECYQIPTAKEMFAVQFLHEMWPEEYKLMLSNDITKPIKKFCELKDSELLRCHMKVVHGKEMKKRRRSR